MGLDVLIASRGEHSLTTEINQGLHLDLDNPGAAVRDILAIAAQADEFVSAEKPGKPMFRVREIPIYSVRSVAP